MPILPILFGIGAALLFASLSSSHKGPRPPRRRESEPDPAPSLVEELDADPVGTLAKYGTAADLKAQGFGDEIRGLGYRD